MSIKGVLPAINSYFAASTINPTGLPYYDNLVPHPVMDTDPEMYLGNPVGMIMCYSPAEGSSGRRMWAGNQDIAALKGVAKGVLTPATLQSKSTARRRAKEVLAGTVKTDESREVGQIETYMGSYIAGMLFLHCGDKSAAAGAFLASAMAYSRTDFNVRAAVMSELVYSLDTHDASAAAISAAYWKKLAAEMYSARGGDALLDACARAIYYGNLSKPVPLGTIAEAYYMSAALPVRSIGKLGTEPEVLREHMKTRSDALVNMLRACRTTFLLHQEDNCPSAFQDLENAMVRHALAMIDVSEDGDLAGIKAELEGI